MRLILARPESTLDDILKVIVVNCDFCYDTRVNCLFNQSYFGMSAQHTKSDN